jgi:transposase
MLQPVRRRTWGPEGQTPIQRAWDCHDRLSVIGTLTVSPNARRLAYYFQLLPHNVDTEDMVWFLTQMHRHFRRRVIIVWDRWSVHKSGTNYFHKHHPDWFQFEPLPAYAPELNPVEPSWGHTKHADLANFLPEDLDDLSEAASSSLSRKRDNQDLLRSFFAYAKLPL